jgi:hypothetical protein
MVLKFLFQEDQQFLRLYRLNQISISTFIEGFNTAQVMENP